MPACPRCRRASRARSTTQAGKLLYDDTWYSSYLAEPKLVRIGPKPKKKKQKPATTTTQTPAQTTTQPTQ